VVAVLDTGVDYTHPDLAADTSANEDESLNGADEDGNGKIDDIGGWDFVYQDNGPMDANGHGTAIAGILGAVGGNSRGIVGVCWNPKIMHLRVICLGDLLCSFVDRVPTLTDRLLSGGRINAQNWLLNLPAYPIGLTATLTSTSTADIYWTSNYSSAITLIIERSESASGPFSEMEAVNATAGPYQDSSLQAEKDAIIGPKPRALAGHPLTRLLFQPAEPQVVAAAASLTRFFEPHWLLKLSFKEDSIPCLFRNIDRMRRTLSFA
jgi:hypothetical protein